KKPGSTATRSRGINRDEKSNALLSEFILVPMDHPHQKSVLFMRIIAAHMSVLVVMYVLA
ncbi:MAG: hypothetical protein R6T99_09755, partial [Bacteroidales bacterium]